jgi:DNA mismatch repair protein MLH1
LGRHQSPVSQREEVTPFRVRPTPVTTLHVSLRLGRGVGFMEGSTPLSLVKERASSQQSIYTDPYSKSLLEPVEPKRKGRMCIYELKSIKKLKDEIVEVDSSCFRSLVYVGRVSGNRVLVQHGYSLMECNYGELLKEYFYQRMEIMKT